MMQFKACQNSVTTILITVLVAITFTLLIAIQNVNAESVTEVSFFNHPQCGCCENYADHMSEKDFVVTRKSTLKLASLSYETDHDNLQDCHLPLITNYFISGYELIRTSK